MPSDMGESQHGPLIEICKAQKVAKFCQGWTVLNDLDLGWVHMYATLIYDVTQVLDLAHAKGALLQVGT